MIRMNDRSKATPHEPTTPMTTFTGHTKVSMASESQVALNNFKKVTKRDTSASPVFKNELYYDTFRDLSWQCLKRKDCMMLLTLIMTLMMRSI